MEKDKYYRTQIKCNLDIDFQKRAADYIINRDKRKYRSVNDYLIEAVLHMEEDNRNLKLPNEIKDYIKTLVNEEMKNEEEST